jgi:phosphoserine phosphatase
MPKTPPFASVYFDCDSTLSSVEGVDELLLGLDDGLRAELLQLTQRAMEGSLPLAEVYETRLKTIAPSRARLALVAERYRQNALPDAALVVAALRRLGKQVGVVSGGLLEPVRAFAVDLGIDPANVHAVPLHFDAQGRYVDFDRECPLWQNGGKIEALRALPQSIRPLAFCGDGVTDLETQGTAADLFVGFGGVAIRAAVKQQAEAWFEQPRLAPLLRFVLTAEELATLAAEPRFAPLLSRQSS